MEDPVQKMTRLQKELDIVRERAAERMEAKLKKSTWNKLTDPLRRHSHSWINVGAVLLAYILAHNLYMTGKEKKSLQEQLDDVTTQRDVYQQAMRGLIQQSTLQEISNEYHKQVSSSQSSSSSWWRNTSKTDTSLGANDQQQMDYSRRLEHVLQSEIQKRIGEFILTDEERRVKAMQKAWQDSQQQVVVVDDDVSSLVPPELQVLQQQILGDNTEVEEGALRKDLDTVPKKQQRRVISM